MLITGLQCGFKQSFGENSGNDYSFLNNDIDDILDRHVKSGVLNLFFHRSRYSESDMTANALCQGLFLLYMKVLLSLMISKNPYRCWQRDGMPSGAERCGLFYLRDNVYWHDQIRIGGGCEFTASTIVSTGSKTPMPPALKMLLSLFGC